MVQVAFFASRCSLVIQLGLFCDKLFFSGSGLPLVAHVVLYWSRLTFKGSDFSLLIQVDLQWVPLFSVVQVDLFCVTLFFSGSG